MGKRSASHMILVGNFRRAIGFGKIIKIQCREIDIENVKKLEKIEGIKVIKKLDEIGI